MRKIREVLRLHFECGRSHREIAQAMYTSTSTVWQYLRRTKLAGLSWPLPADLQTDDVALEARLYPPPTQREPPCGMPDWPTVHREIGKPGVTLDLLWQEYKAQHPDGYGYSWFCKAYQEWAQRLPVTLRQTHVPGQKLFVDYSGKKLGIINPDTGEIREAELFVAALGVSGYTFAELTWTQQLPDWIGSHVRAFAFYEGLCEVLVPDNLRSGVHKANFYEPEINPTYQEMASYYSVAVIPARARKPRDKAKAELSVLLAALCGTSPLQASSGKTVRHRLNRGGDRSANNALWTIAMVRMRSEPRTRAYVERRTKEGMSNKEIHRCLKRYIVRELYPLILADLADSTRVP